MSRPRIAFDIDGVLFPWTTCSVQAVNTRGYSISDDPDAHTTWNWLPSQISKDDWEWLWQGYGLQLMFDRREMVYPGVERMLRRIAAEATIDFVTHRPRAASPYTAKWIAGRGVPFESLHVLGHTPKSRVLQGADVFIDDKTDNVWEALENTTAFVGAPRRPWNEDLAECRHERFLGFYDDPMEVLGWVRHSAAARASLA